MTDRRKIVHASFEDAAALFPDQVAVEHDGRRTTYGELNRRANALARVLLSLGAERGEVVAVCMESSSEYIAAIIGIMKTGAVFMPLDTETPSARLAFLLERAGPRFVVTDADQSVCRHGLLSGAGLPSPLRIVPLPAADESNSPLENPPLRSSPDDALYLVSTSGSTGRPKLIVGMHKSLAHFLHWEIKEFGLDESTRISQIPPVTFDASFRDIFAPLLSGGTVCIPSRSVRSSSSRLLGWLEESRVTLVHCVPSVFRLLMKEAETTPNEALLPALRQMLLAGEALYGRDVLRWMDLVGERIGLVNLYGPSETTLIKFFHRIQERPRDPGKMMPAGQPLPNTAALVLKNNRLCRIGEIGEIHIKTPFMSKGYFHDPELTAKAFVQNPLASDPDIIYRTGDLGRYFPDHSLEFIGRTDSQVKVNGNRVELGEIEACLLNHSAILQAVVTLIDDSDESGRLACYYSEKDPVAPAELREHLSRHLPPYMIPSFFRRMESFPRTVTGKIDRKGLPPPEELESASVEPPSNEIEVRIASIWAEILGRSAIGVTSPYHEIGGTSLKAIQIISRLYRSFGLEITIRDFIEQDTIRKLAAFISHGAVPGECIESIGEQEHYALSHGQHRLWIQCQIESDTAAFNMAGIYEIEGTIDPDVLQRAYALVIRRHESLRTSFVVVAGEPRQRIAADVPFEIKTAACGSGDGVEAFLNQFAAQESGTPFDLERAPLLRAVLLRLGPDRHALLNTVHHLVGDAWSLAVFGREVLAAYNAFIRGQVPELPNLVIQYRDYALWQIRRMEGAVMRANREYWLEKLAGDLVPLHLPFDLPRPLLQTFHGRILRTSIGKELSAKLEDLARARNVSLFTALLAALKILLHRVTAQEDIIVGTAVSGRIHPDLQDQIGFYVNLLAVRDAVTGRDSFDEILARVGTSMAEALTHQEYPFDRLVDDLRLSRDPSLPIIYNIGMDFDQDERDLIPIEGAVLRERESDWNTSNLDLLFYFRRGTDGLLLEINYNTDLFTEDSIRRMARQLEKVFLAGLARPDLQVGEFDLSMPALAVPSPENVPAPRPGETITTLFEERARCFAERPAVIFEDRSITYGELRARSGLLARALVEMHGFTPGRIAGLLTERTEHAVVLVFAILKAGGICFPIDPASPPDRIRRLIEGSGCDLVIADSAGWELCPREFGRVLSMERLFKEAETFDSPLEPRGAVSNDGSAWLLYTSGSTGVPKGVLLHHQGYINMARGLIDRYGITPDDRILQFADLTFDISVTEILSALLSGAALVVAGRERRDNPAALMDYLESRRVTIAALPPTYVNLLDRSIVGRLRVLVTGGEPPIEADARWYGRRLAYFNAYGQTEASAYCTVHRVDPDAKYPLGIPIGTAMPHVILRVLDKDLRPVPEGSTGELCIAGPGVASGYLNDPALTRERFVPDPCGSGRLYRTGDLVRLLADGTVLFQGRIDEQVKVRGFRVEPGEIEAALLKHPAIRLATVVKDDQRDRLVAYLVAADELDARELRTFLGRDLPDHMVPSLFMKVESLPKTSTGKVDRKALPEPARFPEEAGAALPRSEDEARVLAVFREILRDPALGIHDEFFSRGGTSLDAVRLSARMHDEMRIGVSARLLFQNPTASAYAGALRELNAVARSAAAGPVAARSNARIERRPLQELIETGLMERIDAAALEALPDDLVPPGADRNRFVESWFGGNPVLSGVTTTSLGRIGNIILPIFSSKLFEDEALLADMLRSATTLAGRAGAKIVSLTGLLPAATRQGEILNTSTELPALTTAQATVTAVRCLTVEAILAAGGRDPSRERIAFLGSPESVAPLLGLMLEVIPHPREILFCGSGPAMEDLAIKAVRDWGFQGRIGPLDDGGELPARIYDATLIIGTAGTPGLLDVGLVRPGTMIISDPASPCLDEEAAQSRLEKDADILFSDGDLLASPASVSRCVYLPEGAESVLSSSLLESLLLRDEGTITGCVLSGLLSHVAREAGPTRGTLRAEACLHHYHALLRLGFRSAGLCLGEIPLPEEAIQRFRARFGTRLAPREGLSATIIPWANDEVFESFMPGRNLVIRKEWRRRATIVTPAVTVTAPGRLHFSIFDYTQMRPPLPGGGGIGISTGIFENWITLSVGSPGAERRHIPPSARHIFLLFRALLGNDLDDIAIEVRTCIPHAHCGFGSNVTLNTGIFWGLNAIFGYPFTREEAFTILTHNYIESTDENHVHWGFETGVGEAALLFGGVVLVDEICRFVNSIPAPELFSVVAKSRMSALANDDYIRRGLVEAGETGVVEARINEEIGMVHQREFGHALNDFLDLELVPAFRAADYVRLCERINRLNDLGTFKRMQQSYRKDVMLAFERTGRELGALYCGISSAGPALFGIMPDRERAEQFKTRIEREFAGFIEFVLIGRAGRPLEVKEGLLVHEPDVPGAFLPGAVDSMCRESAASS